MVTLFYGISLIFTRWPPRPDRKTSLAIFAALMSLPLLLFLFSAELSPGVRFDLGHVPIVATTVVAGPAAGFLVSLPLILFRLWRYGLDSGTLPAVGNVLLLVGWATFLRRFFTIRHNFIWLSRHHLPLVMALFSVNGLPALLLPDGLSIFRVSYAPLLLLNISGFYIVSKLFQDRFFLLKALQNATREARIDGLSGVFNRRQFDEDLSQLGAGDLLLMIDIDHFKRINDTFGHATGDAVLIELGQTLSRALRQTDTAYRFGGEEFAVIVRHTAPEHAALIAERLHQRLCQMPLNMLGGQPLTVSIGGAAGQTPGQAPGQVAGPLSPAAVLERADQALYHAKHTGRNRAVIWEESLGGGGTEPPGSHRFARPS